MNLASAGTEEATQPPTADTIAATEPVSLVDEEKRLDAIETLSAYVEEHGTSYGTISMYTFDTGVPDTTIYLLMQGDV